MICVVFGTTGELIKLAPILVRLRERGDAPLLVTTGQQATQIGPLLEELGLPQPDLWLARGAGGRDLQANSDIPRWLARVTRSLVRERRTLRDARLVLVHGDTMTTLIGAAAGRALRLPVAHVEAGMRSGDLRHPFPEEPIRRIVSRLASVHYAPGAYAARNLRHGTVVDTQLNTLRDSLRLVPQGIDPGVPIPEEPFGLVSLHRFELINDRRRLTETLAVLDEAAARTPLLFVDHPVSVEMIERFRLADRFGPRFVRIPRLRFFPFVSVLRSAAYVVTDSGGSQEECWFLDIPCLVHRLKTERHEGLGENAVLSGFDLERLRTFLANPGAHRRRMPLPDVSPSDIVVDDLVTRAFAGRP